jgi:hypothetical protein
MRLKQILVPALLAVGTFVVAWLLGTGALSISGNLNLWVPVGLEVLAGVIGGYLLRSWWAVLTVPIAILLGMALESLVQYGRLWQGAAAEVVPLAIIALIVLLVPTAVGTLIGVSLNRRVAAHA